MKAWNPFHLLVIYGDFPTCRGQYFSERKEKYLLSPILFQIYIKYLSL